MWRWQTQTLDLVGLIFSHTGQLGSKFNFLHCCCSSELWGFLSAAFPKAKYCLCTATMTDKALERIAGDGDSDNDDDVDYDDDNNDDDDDNDDNHDNHDKCINNSLESLDIDRSEMRVLFRPPSRPNIFLQTRLASLSRLSDPELAVQFLLPFVCDDKRLKVQLFTRTREQANLICKENHFPEKNL